MEEPRIPKTEVGKEEPPRDQEHAHHVFRHSRDCASWIYPRWPDGERQVLLQCSSLSEGGHSAKRPELWRAGNWLLHDDNTPSHWALVMREFLAHNSIITLPHPPYSPDLVPCDFFFFPKMKLQLKGHRFDRMEEIQRESQNVLGTLRE